MRFIPLLVIPIALAATPLLEAQTAAPSPAPAASPAQAKKHKHKTALKAGDASTTAATASASPVSNAGPGPSPAASPKRSHKKAAPAAKHPTPSAVADSAPSPRLDCKTFERRTPDRGTPASGIAAGSAKPAKPVGNAVATAGGGNGLVWVNTQTHVYHKQGSRYYGKTKQGKYLSEQDAMSECDRPAAKGE
jgi:hypothetical protein